MDNSFEEVLVNGDKEALDNLKRFLFEENIRLTLKQKEIDEIIKKFNEERSEFMTEKNSINLRIVNERKRLKDEEMFFEKKMDILKNGFAQLEADRRKLQAEKAEFDKHKSTHHNIESAIVYEDIAQSMFAGVNNPLALRKRYRDLLKIFHPDNLCGDSNMSVLITKEYERLKQVIDYPFRNVN